MRTPFGRGGVLATAAFLILILGLGGAVIYGSYSWESRVADQYHADRHLLQMGVDAALQQGYTNDDLGPVIDGLSQADRNQPSPVVWIQLARYQKLDESMRGLRSELPGIKKAALAKDQADATSSLQVIHDRLAKDQSLLDPDDLSALLLGLDQLNAAEAKAQLPKDYRAVSEGSQSLNKKVAEIETTQQAENDAITKAAADLKAQGDLGAIRQKGQDAIRWGRNYATAAAFLSREDVAIDVRRPNQRLERYAGPVGDPDPDRATFAAAAVIRYSEQIKDAVIKVKPKMVLVSIVDQHMWSYDGGKLFLENGVVTGRDALPSDIGPGQICRKNSPWTMHSTRKKDDPYWYPDTVVQWASWFCNRKVGMDDGTAFHDAVWQSGWFGDTNHYHGGGSHGCINMPNDAAQAFYNWSDTTNTYVAIIPGDGSPAAQQVKQDTVDDPYAANSVLKGI